MGAIFLQGNALSVLRGLPGDFFHFDDRPENIQVLCVSCHMSLHKKAYWDAIHAGVVPTMSNGRVGWRKGGDDNGSNLPRGE